MVVQLKCGRQLYHLPFPALDNILDPNQEPFPKNLNIAGNIKKKALDLGLICYPTQGTVDGTVGDHILIAPPFIINENEMNEISQKLKNTIEYICN